MKTLLTMMTLAALGGAAFAQPLPPPVPRPEPQPDADAVPAADADAPAVPAADADAPAVPAADADAARDAAEALVHALERREPGYLPEPPPPDPPPPPMPELPHALLAPTGRLLAAGALYSRTSLDTSGGLASELVVGLGDVADFGLATTDLIRRRVTAGGELERIAPYVTASFTMGVAEDRLFRGQPALALGFQKSFEHETEGFATRVAELHLVGTRRLGPLATVHLGGVFWDAAIQDVATGETRTLHDRGVRRQLRGYGGVEVTPLPDAQILVDLWWAPEFCYQCGATSTHLAAILSWGVRYRVAGAMFIEAGVRVPDIKDANLLDAQIFGQVTFLTRRLRRALSLR